MKHIKKRAMLSAIAMLVVTAVALSSATFAWFSAGTAVGVDTITATVSNTDGTLLISADNTNWKTQLSAADIEGVVTNVFPIDNKFTPVSLQLETGGATIYSGNITNAKFTSTANAAAGFIKYTVHLKSSTTMTVTVSPSFASTAAFVYAGITDGTSKVLLNGQGTRSYYAINAPLTNVQDSPPYDDIISAPGETAALNLSLQGPAALSGSITMTLAPNVSQPFTVYIWAEGQDAACSGPLGTQNTTMSFSVTKNP